MTKKELIDALSNWPDDAVVEVSVPSEDSATWHELTGVENFTGHDTKHCLLYAGNITML